MACVVMSRMCSGSTANGSVCADKIMCSRAVLNWDACNVEEAFGLGPNTTHHTHTTHTCSPDPAPPCRTHSSAQPVICRAYSIHPSATVTPQPPMAPDLRKRNASPPKAAATVLKDAPTPLDVDWSQFPPGSYSRFGHDGSLLTTLLGAFSILFTWAVCKCRVGRWGCGVTEQRPHHNNLSYCPSTTPHNRDRRRPLTAVDDLAVSVGAYHGVLVAPRLPALPHHFPLPRLAGLRPLHPQPGRLLAGAYLHSCV